MWWIFLPVGAILAAAWFTEPSIELLVSAVVAIAVIGIAGVIFTRLTIRVDANGVTWHIGWGWPDGALATSEIERAEITRTSLFEGWGIHWTIWHGWLWNVGGFQAVEITKTDGCRITLGTDDPQGLFQAIERFRKGAA